MPIPSRKQRKNIMDKRLEHDILTASYYGTITDVEAAIMEGADVDTQDEDTGLTPLHIAVGLNKFELAKTLAEKYGSKFVPDKFGRMPSSIAAFPTVSEELSDYVVEKEAEFEFGPRSSWPPHLKL